MSQRVTITISDSDDNDDGDIPMGQPTRSLSPAVARLKRRAPTPPVEPPTLSLPPSAFKRFKTTVEIVTAATAVVYERTSRQVYYESLVGALLSFFSDQMDVANLTAEYLSEPADVARWFMQRADAPSEPFERSFQRWLLAINDDVANPGRANAEMTRQIGDLSTELMRYSPGSVIQKAEAFRRVLALRDATEQGLPDVELLADSIGRLAVILLLPFTTTRKHWTWSTYSQWHLAMTRIGVPDAQTVRSDFAIQAIRVNQDRFLNSFLMFVRIQHSDFYYDIWMATMMALESEFGKHDDDDDVGDTKANRIAIHQLPVYWVLLLHARRVHSENRIPDAADMHRALDTLLVRRFKRNNLSDVAAIRRMMFEFVDDEVFDTSHSILASTSTNGPWLRSDLDGPKPWSLIKIMNVRALCRNPKTQFHSHFTRDFYEQEVAAQAPPVPDSPKSPVYRPVSPTSEPQDGDDDAE